MRAKQKHVNLGTLDVFFLAVAIIFLGSALLRVYGPDDLNDLRTRAASLITGKLSTEEVVQAFGSWRDTEHITAVFQAVDFDETPVGMTSVTSNSGFEGDILSLRSSLFPDTVDQITYLIDLPCKNPTEGVVSSGFGSRTDPVEGSEGFHYGIDIAAEEGTAIYAVAPGIVQDVGDNSYGKYVVIDHGDGLQSLYAHCSSTEVSEGQLVEAHERIAGVGMTGKATGNHLHFELWRAGMILDPTAYLEVI